MQAPVQSKMVEPRQEVDGSRIPELKSIVSDALARARELGATQSEADVSLQKGLTTTVRLGEVETVPLVFLYVGDHEPQVRGNQPFSGCLVPLLSAPGESTLFFRVGNQRQALNVLQVLIERRRRERAG